MSHIFFLHNKLKTICKYPEKKYAVSYFFLAFITTRLHDYRVFEVMGISYFSRFFLFFYAFIMEIILYT